MTYLRKKISLAPKIRRWPSAIRPTQQKNDSDSAPFASCFAYRDCAKRYLQRRIHLLRDEESIMVSLKPKRLGKVASLAILAMSVSCSAPSALAPNGVPGKSQTTSLQARAGRPTEAELSSWRLMMLRVPKPGACTMATYPQRQWQAVPCGKTRNIPVVPAHGNTVGDTAGDYSAQEQPPVGVLIAEGLFPQVSGVTSEHSKYYPSLANDYSLQLNTQLRCPKLPLCYGFPTATCKTLGSPQPQKCGAWEQFVYQSNGGIYYPGLFMEYWLINFAPVGSAQCPIVGSKYWNPYIAGNELDCWINSSQINTPLFPVTSLDDLTLYGQAAFSRSQPRDEADMYDSDAKKFYRVDGDNWFPELAQQWKDAEFNVFGNGGGDEAVFNTGSKITVRTEVDGTAPPMAPKCYLQSFTGETNNLSLSATSMQWPKGELPSIIFKESIPPNGKKSCAHEP